MDVWITTGDQKSLLKHSPQVILPASDTRFCPTIGIDAAQAFQTMDGFGFTLTGGSAQLIASLDIPRRQKILNELFSTKNGIGISYLRLSIGASDLSASVYSYDDMPKGQTDFDLAYFNLYAGDKEVVPVLKQIIAITPQIKFMASPWSAPAWMKDNESFIGGSLKPECYSVYAKYFVRYLQAMKNEGIKLHSLTPQNEPLHGGNEPSLLMLAIQQVEFIKNHLGPAIRDAGFDTKIICWDHNCDKPEYPMTVLGDADANKFTQGSAWHLYGGTPAAMSLVHDAYPDKEIHFTEQWLGAKDEFAGSLKWHARNVLIGSARNWAQVILEWNLASDPTCRPHTPGGSGESVGGVTIGETITKNVNLYVIAHASKFIPPGSVRIASNDLADLTNVAFKTPRGQTVLIVLNDADYTKRFAIDDHGVRTTLELPAGALATCVWKTKPKPEPRSKQVQPKSLSL